MKGEDVRQIFALEVIRKDAEDIEDFSKDLKQPLKDIVLYANSIIKDIAESGEVTPYAEEKAKALLERIKEVL